MNSQPQSNDSLPTRGSLLAAAIGSEPEAWQQLVNLYEPRMLRWCRGQGLDRIATADVIQDAWLSVARGLASFRSQPGAGAFRAWLHQIVRRRIADYRRREVLRPPAVGGSSFAMRVAEQPYESNIAPSSHDDPSQCLSQSNGYLQRAMATVQQEIEPKTWQAFWLCVVDQRSTDEVAHLLEITPANVRQCRSRVLRRLRQTMERLRAR
jgi:RNA polymerase sigma-70 factor (ECF subfamily)